VEKVTADMLETERGLYSYKWDLVVQDMVGVPDMLATQETEVQE
jgi:hypothetical protein